MPKNFLDSSLLWKTLEIDEETFAIVVKNFCDCENSSDMENQELDMDAGKYTESANNEKSSELCTIYNFIVVSLQYKFIE